MTKLDDVTLRATATKEWSAEHWQFFAFVFAALLTLTYALIDYVLESGWRRALVQVSMFVALGWLTLFCQCVKSCLVRLLRVVKR